MARGSKHAFVSINEACNQRCSYCKRPPRLTERPEDLARDLAQQSKGELTKLVLMGGEPLLHPELPWFIQVAKEAEIERVFVRTNATALSRRSVVDALVAYGLDGAEVKLPTGDPKIYAAVTGNDKTFKHAVKGIRNVLEAGLEVTLEVPLVGQGDKTLVDLVAFIEKYFVAAGEVSEVRFVYPPNPSSFNPSSAYASPPLRAITGDLVQAMRRLRELDITPVLVERGGVPFCALAHHEGITDDDLEAFHYNPTRQQAEADEHHKGAACETCVYRRQCFGLLGAYVGVYGDGELAPITERLEGLRRDSRSKVDSQRWSSDRATMSKEITQKILRVTMRCNQRCIFCPSDETSENILPHPNQIRKKIARWARLGVFWLSLSGGEPTLVKELPSYVRIAKGLGIRYVELVTNAIRSANRDYARVLVDAGVDRAFISLHSHKADLSHHMTATTNDHHKTLEGIKNYADLGIKVVVNHVISALNYKDLPDFVRFMFERYGDKVEISYAFITPLFKVLSAMDLVPRYSDVQPYLHRAMDYSMSVGQPFVVLSRPGVPPCILGPRYERFSDLYLHAYQAMVEDEPKKAKAPTCVECTWNTICGGVWKPYAERYGTDELVPITEALRKREGVAGDPKLGVPE